MKGNSSSIFKEFRDLPLHKKRQIEIPSSGYINSSNINKSYKELYLKKALDAVPRILSLIDKNPFSPTYGCVDREYWHYKMRDFPMSIPQMSALLLALVYKYKLPNPFKTNIYHNNPIIKELALATINFTAHSSHNDGSCDEYYPYERALGVVSFTLYACTEAYLILENEISAEEKLRFKQFFEKRARWLLTHDEPGIISNHQIVTAVALLNVYFIIKKPVYMTESKKRLSKALKWMSDEGWFYEYDGCDPGYHTFSIDFLAKYYKKTNDAQLMPYLRRTVEFASYFIHPDGSYAGFYGSRNTAHFLPHGFEILGKKIPLATQIADLYLKGMENNKHEFMNDDKYFFFDYDYLQAYIDFCEKRTGVLNRKDFKKYFNKSHFFVGKLNDGKFYIIVNCIKGGQMRIFKNNENILNDAGFIGILNNNQLFVSHFYGDKKISADEKGIFIKGKCCIVNTTLMTPLKLILLRCFLTTIGRYNSISKFLKKILTKQLILKKTSIPIYFERELTFNNNFIYIKDTIRNLSGINIKKLAFGTTNTSIYIPSSRFYQEADLDQWLFIEDRIKELNDNKQIIVKRVIK